MGAEFQFGDGEFEFNIEFDIFYEYQPKSHKRLILCSIK